MAEAVIPGPVIAQLQAILTQDAEADRIALVWPEPVEPAESNREVAETSLRLVYCPSELSIRERLVQHKPGNQRLVILSPFDETRLGKDVLARLWSNEPKRISPWRTLEQLLRVKQIDPAASISSRDEGAASASVLRRHVGPGIGFVGEAAAGVHPVVLVPGQIAPLRQVPEHRAAVPVGGQLRVLAPRGREPARDDVRRVGAGRAPPGSAPDHEAGPVVLAPEVPDQRAPAVPVRAEGLHVPAGVPGGDALLAGQRDPEDRVGVARVPHVPVERAEVVAVRHQGPAPLVGSLCAARRFGEGRILFRRVTRSALQRLRGQPPAPGCREGALDSKPVVAQCFR